MPHRRLTKSSACDKSLKKPYSCLHRAHTFIILIPSLYSYARVEHTSDDKLPWWYAALNGFVAVVFIRNNATTNDECKIFSVRKYTTAIAASWFTLLKVTFMLH